MSARNNPSPLGTVTLTVYVPVGVLVVVAKVTVAISVPAGRFAAPESPLLPKDILPLASFLLPGTVSEISMLLMLRLFVPSLAANWSTPAASTSDVFSVRVTITLSPGATEVLSAATVK